MMTTTEASQRRFSDTLSNNRKGIRTPDELIMMANFNHRKIAFDENAAIETGLIEKHGHRLVYYPDFSFAEKVTLEIFGKGTSSDNPERHKWLIDNGYTPLYASNKSVKASPSLVADYVEAVIELCRLRRMLR